ncbi:MAG TPA: hypothetical protein VFA71_11880 [Terriglobales bacterium]|nr:hypothetical protein [Terriglobales bacterium]
MILFACALFALALLAYVFAVPQQIAAAPIKDRVAYLHERKEVIYENLRDLNFENKAGKFSPEDYQGLRTSLEEEAARALAEIAELEGASSKLQSASYKPKAN